MFKFLRKDKRGLSLMELIIAVALVGFVISIAGQFLATSTKVFNLSQQQWDVQNAVQLACTKFETGIDAITSAYRADLLYDNAVADLDGGIIYNSSTGSITWRNGKSSKLIPAEGADMTGNRYTYIFSAPTYDTSGKYLGKYLYVRDFDSSNTKLYLDNEGCGDVPVDISFRVAVSPATISGGHYESTQSYQYMDTTVEVKAISGLEGVSNYSMVTQYSMNNFNGSKMSYNGDLPIVEYSWGTDVLPAGWVDAYEVDSGDSDAQPIICRPNDIVKVKNDSGATIGVIGDGTLEETKVDVSGAPTQTMIKPIKPDNTEGEEVDISTSISKEANVMRFISERAVMERGEVAEMTSSTLGASCLSHYLFSDGTKNGARTIWALRDFRDNVLKGTAFGDWFISKYYNTWSPALVSVCQEHEWVKSPLKAVISPLSKVLGALAVE